MKFKTKAQNLSNIKLKNAKIPYLFFFRVKDYKKNKKKYASIINKKFKSKIAIRSSSHSEDNLKKSFAGYFESFLNINPNNHLEIISAIDKVVLSLKRNSSNKDEILIQEMVKKPKISGVAMSADKDSGAPYYSINYSISKDTSAVTAGKKGSKTFIYYKFSPQKVNILFLKKIILLLKELELKFNYPFIDIEFIIDEKGKINLVQVRPLVVKENKIIPESISKSLNKLVKKIKKLQNKHHDLLGRTTAFGVMPDWNPAEIIGYKPKPLAMSLYQELITDHVWSQQRKNYGFRDVGSNHLMANFFGTPYIDIRVDFNSWVPNSLNKKLSNKLVDFYIQKFKKNKNFHDKVEFEILFTCYTPSTEKRIYSELNHHFTKKEIQQIIKSLKLINIFSFDKFKDDIKKIEILKKKQEEITKSKMYFIDKIYWLIEDCKRYGTLPFAGLARNAFIATDILKGLTYEKILTSNKVQNLLRENNTITSEIFKDMSKLNKKRFLKKYGHLRPNTYEINSQNYREGYNLYFDKNFSNKKLQRNFNKVQFTNVEKKKIEFFIKKMGANFKFYDFIEFIKESIRLREYSKYIFSRSIDLIFENLKIFGKRLNINKIDLSYLTIKSITDLYYNLSFNNLKKSFKEEIRNNKKDYQLNLNLKLPETISNISDIYYYHESENKINFVGNSNSLSDVIHINSSNINKKTIKNKIVCIESADPGYDFIFLSDINGLITKYGGVNSHMSVRCSELNLPAAIGVGEKKFNELIKSKKINLDCTAKKIEIVS